MNNDSELENDDTGEKQNPCLKWTARTVIRVMTMNGTKIKGDEDVDILGTTLSR